MANLLDWKMYSFFFLKTLVNTTRIWKHNFFLKTIIKTPADNRGLKDPTENVNARIAASYHLGKLLLDSGHTVSAIR